MIREEIALFEKLTGEDANEVSIARIGGFLDGYKKAKEEHDKYRWHDLRKNPEDLPEAGKTYLVFTTTYGYSVDTRHKNEKKHRGHWGFFNGDEVIAWRELEQFEE